MYQSPCYCWFKPFATTTGLLFAVTVTPPNSAFRSVPSARNTLDTKRRRMLVSWGRKARTSWPKERPKLAEAWRVLGAVAVGPPAIVDVVRELIV